MRFSYPIDGGYLLKKRKALKRELLTELQSGQTPPIQKKIAVLGGSTTHDLVDMLELFLLDYGILPKFYESEYQQFWQDIMFEQPKLMEFCPDLIYIHTSSRNLVQWPQVSQSAQEVQQLLTQTLDWYRQMWDKARMLFHCPIIQNNFEFLPYRLLGNQDSVDVRGRNHFITMLNAGFASYAQEQDGFYLQDLCYVAADYGLSRWADAAAWHMYKYACAVEAIPDLAWNLSHMIKALWGKNQKAFMLDLDNTLWGGVVGDDGPESIEIGQETAQGQVYHELQTYFRLHRDMGILLTVNSKNEMEIARSGLERPDSVLKPEDFTVIKANWNPKDQNYREICRELNLGTDSFVFVDDNPAERHRVRMEIPEAVVPEWNVPEECIRILDRGGYFETLAISQDDLSRAAMYAANHQRQQQAASYENYRDYLLSLQMQAEIQPFSPLYLSRIAQLTNKSNQFNLTTRRYTQSQLEEMAQSPEHITLYGKLSDRFGDNGVVSVVAGHGDGEAFHIDLWLMSCRVLKRDMEFAMMDALVERCKEKGYTMIYGYYYPTAKNQMVAKFYGEQGFAQMSCQEDGATIWKYQLDGEYRKKNSVIEMI